MGDAGRIGAHHDWVSKQYGETFVMRILLTGKTVRLGMNCATRWPCMAEVIDSAHDCDFTDADAIEALVSRVKPHVIINPAAYTAVDRAEWSLIGHRPSMRRHPDTGETGTTHRRPVDSLLDRLRIRWHPIDGAHTEVDRTKPDQRLWRHKARGERRRSSRARAI